MIAKAGVTVDRLIEAGAELADEIGFERVTGAALARRFDVRLASLYAHMASLDALKCQIALLSLTQLADASAEAMAGRSGRDALWAIADVHRDYAHRHPGRFAAARHPLSREQAVASSGPRLARMMGAVARGYGLPEWELPHAVRFLGSFLLGYPTLEISTGFAHSSPDSEASWRRGLGALDAALEHWPRGCELQTEQETR